MKKKKINNCPDSLNVYTTLNNQEEYFRQYEKVYSMIFLNNTLIKLSHIVFNISLVLIYDQCYPLHENTTTFFTFDLVIVNAIIFD